MLIPSLLLLYIQKSPMIESGLCSHYELQIDYEEQGKYLPTHEFPFVDLMLHNNCYIPKHVVRTRA